MFETAPWLVIVVLAWGGICTAWAGILFAQFCARRDGLFLPARNEDNELAGPPPSVTVVIPARNEAQALESCLRRVLAQDYPDLSVIIADDRSTDATAKVAESIARSDPRVRIVHIDELPPGWMGKSHALWSATRQATTDWLLFLDVDCALEPHAVCSAICEARRRNVSLLTLWPRQAPGGFWEHMLIPLCAAIIALWFGSRRRAPFANGQFLLIQRDAYERIGGHRAVHSALIEDVPLAELAARAGVPSWVASGRDLVAVRMYESYAAILDGWARIYIGALRSGAKIGLSVLWLIAGSLLPYVAAVVLAVVAFWRPNAIEPPALATLGGLCAAHLALMLAASYRFWGLGGCKRSYLVLYPLSAIVVIRILLRAGWWLVVRRSVPWRDRSYAIDRRGVIVE